jgi:hypothetical protein
MGRQHDLSFGPFHAAGLMGEVKRNPEFIGGGKSLVGENIVMTAQWRIVSDPKRCGILPQPNQLPE